MTGKTCVLALDQGTTSSRAILFDHRGAPLAVVQEEFPQHARAAAGPDGSDLGIVEHDPEDIWRTQLSCARRVLTAAGVAADHVAAIGITNQRETTILWDRATGRPVAPAVVWQSRVSAPICARLKAEGHEAEIRRRTGLLLDPYFSATKILHLFETVPGVRERLVAVAPLEPERSPTCRSTNAGQSARSLLPVLRPSVVSPCGAGLRAAAVNSVASGAER